MAYVIALPRVDLKDRACVGGCPVDCGACEPVCSAEAIRYQRDLPVEWTGYRAVNAEFFDELGSPGAAGRVGPIPQDDAFVAALPPRETE